MRKPKIVLSIFCLLAATNLFSQECSRLVPEPQETYFVLVIDRSGSMSGQPLEDAKMAVIQFINSMQLNDRAAIITFEDEVQVLHRFTSDRSSLVNSVKNIRPGGMTRFYDALAAGAVMLSEVQGQKAVLFLTDGNDNSSNFSLRNIRSMNIGEGNIVYGIGLGDVNHDEIRDISSATGGVYKIADRSSDLTSVYDELQRYHYQTVKEVYSAAGGYSITSFPGNQSVLLDGREIGKTPVKVDNVQEGPHIVQIRFAEGIWECKGEAKAGYKTVIEARASDLPADFYVESSPGAAAVFIDDTYVGMTSLLPSVKTASGPDYTDQLRIKDLPEGPHHIKIIAAPDSNISSTQVLEFDFEMGQNTRYVNAMIFMGQAKFQNGEVLKRDPFESLKNIDSMFGGLKTSSFGN